MLRKRRSLPANCCRPVDVDLLYKDKMLSLHEKNHPLLFYELKYIHARMLMRRGPARLFWNDGSSSKWLPLTNVADLNAAVEAIDAKEYEQGKPLGSITIKIYVRVKRSGPRLSTRDSFDLTRFRIRDLEPTPPPKPARGSIRLKYSTPGYSDDDADIDSCHAPPNNDKRESVEVFRESIRRIATAARESPQPSLLQRKQKNEDKESSTFREIFSEVVEISLTPKASRPKDENLLSPSSQIEEDAASNGTFIIHSEETGEVVPRSEEKGSRTLLDAQTVELQPEEEPLVSPQQVCATTTIALEHKHQQTESTTGIDNWESVTLHMVPIRKNSEEPEKPTEDPIGDEVVLLKEEDAEEKESNADLLESISREGENEKERLKEQTDEGIAKTTRITVSTEEQPLIEKHAFEEQIPLFEELEDNASKAAEDHSIQTAREEMVGEREISDESEKATDRIADRKSINEGRMEDLGSETSDHSTPEVQVELIPRSSSETIIIEHEDSDEAVEDPIGDYADLLEQEDEELKEGNAESLESIGQDGKNDNDPSREQTDEGIAKTTQIAMAVDEQPLSDKMEDLGSEKSDRSTPDQVELISRSSSETMIIKYDDPDAEAFDVGADPASPSSSAKNDAAELVYGDEIVESLKESDAEYERPEKEKQLARRSSMGEDSEEVKESDESEDEGEEEEEMVILPETEMIPFDEANQEERDFSVDKGLAPVQIVVDSGTPIDPAEEVVWPAPAKSISFVIDEDADDQAEKRELEGEMREIEYDETNVGDEKEEGVKKYQRSDSMFVEEISTSDEDSTVSEKTAEQEDGVNTTENLEWGGAPEEIIELVYEDIANVDFQGSKELEYDSDKGEDNEGQQMDGGMKELETWADDCSRQLIQDLLQNNRQTLLPLSTFSLSPAPSQDPSNTEQTTKEFHQTRIMVVENVETDTRVTRRQTVTGEARFTSTPIATAEIFNWDGVNFSSDDSIKEVPVHESSADFEGNPESQASARHTNIVQINVIANRCPQASVEMDIRASDNDTAEFALELLPRTLELGETTEVVSAIGKNNIYRSSVPTLREETRVMSTVIDEVSDGEEEEDLIKELIYGECQGEGAIGGEEEESSDSIDANETNESETTTREA